MSHPMNYATIDEAWGDLSGTLKKKKKTKDPICELYEQKVNSSAYSQLELVNNANEQYNKSKYQRTMKPLVYSEEQEREPPVKKYYNIPSTEQETSKSLFEKQFEIKHPKIFESDFEEEECKKPVYDERRIVTDEEPDDMEEYIYKRHIPRPSPPMRNRKPTYYEEYLDDMVEYQQKQKFAYVDILLYIISGIILIFLLEQFVQIGINMQRF